jgi:hypothetical protein
MLVSQSAFISNYIPYGITNFIAPSCESAYYKKSIILSKVGKIIQTKFHIHTIIDGGYHGPLSRYSSDFELVPQVNIESDRG